MIQNHSIDLYRHGVGGGAGIVDFTIVPDGPGVSHINVGVQLFGYAPDVPPDIFYLKGSDILAIAETVRRAMKGTT